MALLYNDWRVFVSLYPEQAELRNIQGKYWYRYPQGENIPEVRERIRSWLTTLVRDYQNKKVMAITHNMTILALRANVERLSADEFLRLDSKDRPINCGVTIYRGTPDQGKDGTLVLETYNEKLY